MRIRTMAAAVMLMTMAGTAAAAEMGGYLGASYGRASFDNDNFDGADDGYKIMAGGYAGIIGGEIGYVNFGNLGGNSDGPDAKAWNKEAKRRVAVFRSKGSCDVSERVQIIGEERYHDQALEGHRELSDWRPYRALVFDVYNDSSKQEKYLLQLKDGNDKRYKEKLMLRAKSAKRITVF